MSDPEQPEDLLRYDILTQEALLGVIRRILDEVAKTGLPGDHHFFITFDTQFPSVKLSDRMRERYPEEMTIVIQHTFWNLKVTSEHFEIDLSFDDIQERLSIPFAAVKGFFDPSVKFGLQFDLAAQMENTPVPEPAMVTSIPPKSDSKPPAKVAKRDVTAAKPVKKASKTKSKAKTTKKQKTEIVVDEVDGPTAEVVSLDAFRKKK